MIMNDLTPSASRNTVSEDSGRAVLIVEDEPLLLMLAVDIVEEAGLAYLHVFPFSPRPGTPAAKMPQLPRSVVKARAERLRQAGDDALRSHLQARVGRTVHGLVEREGLARAEDFTEVTFENVPGGLAQAKLDRSLGQQGRTSGGVLQLTPPYRSLACFASRDPNRDEVREFKYRGICRNHRRVCDCKGAFFIGGRPIVDRDFKDIDCAAWRRDVDFTFPRIPDSIQHFV